MHVLTQRVKRFWFDWCLATPRRAFISLYVVSLLALGLFECFGHGLVALIMKVY